MARPQTAPDTPAAPRLTVLNAGGKDPWQAFPQRAGSPEAPGHAPVNFHAYAACTSGVFADRVTEDAELYGPGRPVLLLLRRDLGACERALDQLLTRGCTVAVGLKETGTSQVAALLEKPRLLASLRAILGRAHGAIAATPYLVSFYRGLLPPGRDTACVQFIPTPYPVGEPGWDFSLPRAERGGILVGTREFSTPSRGHLAALVNLLPLARECGVPVTVCNTEGALGRKLLAQLPYPTGLLRVLEGKRAYPEYLRLLATHHLVFQLDASGVPGQVAGDCLLAGVPCVGGNGAIERLCFPGSNGIGRTPEELLELARRLLVDEEVYTQRIKEVRDLARVTVSYDIVAKELAEYFASL